MKIDFDSRGRCVYAALEVQKRMEDLKSFLFDDSCLEIKSLWRIKPAKLGENSVPECLSERNALESLVDIFSNSSGDGSLAKKRPVRYPGLIGVSESTIKAVTTMVEAKKSLAYELQCLSRQEKILFWSKFPGWTGIEVLRAPVVVETPKMIRFYWQCGSSIVRRSAREWHAIFSGVLVNEMKIPKCIRNEIVDIRCKELHYLESLGPEVALGTYRTTRPSVRARLSYPGSVGIIYNASLPFFMKSGSSIKIKPLRDIFSYAAQPRDEARSRAKLQLDPIFPGSNLYRYLRD